MPRFAIRAIVHAVVPAADEEGAKDEFDRCVRDRMEITDVDVTQVTEQMVTSSTIMLTPGMIAFTWGCRHCGKQTMCSYAKLAQGKPVCDCGHMMEMFDPNEE
jgi:hypothetical protein